MYSIEWACPSKGNCSLIVYYINTVKRNKKNVNVNLTSKCKLNSNSEIKREN